MRKVTYLAVFEPSSDGSYGVSFPDLPGCISWGKDFDEAQHAAVDALGLHIYGMEKDGEMLPIPSKTPAIDPATAPGYLVGPITVLPELVADELDNRRIKTTVSIPGWVRDLANEKGLNCSRLLEAAILDAANIQRPVRGF